MISLSSRFFIYSSSCCIDTSMLSWMQTSPFLSSSLDTYGLFILSLICKALCIVMSFLVLLSICQNSSFVHFKNCSEYLTRGTAQIFIPLMRFLPCSLFSSSFFRPPEVFFLLLFLFFLCVFDGVRLLYSLACVSFLFSVRSDFFLIWYFYSFRHLSFSAFHY